MRRAGVVTAVVDEVHAEQGRVRVEYRGMQQSLLSPWAYIAAPMSGRGRGALFMPERGDEVLICYGDGDFAHPYVVGFLWNGEQTSPETEAHNRVIVTPGKNQLRFEDKENDTRVVLRSCGGRELLLDDKPQQGKVQLKSAGNRVLLDDSTGATKVEIRAGSALGVVIEMKAEPQPSLSIRVGSTHIISVDQAGVSLQTSGQVNVQCSSANITAPTMTSITTGALNVQATMATFSGVVQCQSLVSTGAVSGSAFTPAPGNTYGL
jgi:phage baseplate assembly protein gpV